MSACLFLSLVVVSLLCVTYLHRIACNDVLKFLYALGLTLLFVGSSLASTPPLAWWPFEMQLWLAVEASLEWMLALLESLRKKMEVESDLCGSKTITKGTLSTLWRSVLPWR